MSGAEYKFGDGDKLRWEVLDAGWFGGPTPTAAESEMLLCYKKLPAVLQKMTRDEARASGFVTGRFLRDRELDAKQLGAAVGDEVDAENAANSKAKVAGAENRSEPRYEYADLRDTTDSDFS